MVRSAIAGALLCAAAGCASAPGATPAQLDRRAAIDLGCPASYLERARLDARTVVVQGCQRRVVYVESCQRIRGAHRCTWVADSPWIYATTVQIVQPAPVGPRAPTGDGFLDVVAVEGSCAVSVDGRPLGATPITGAALAAGSATVSCIDGERRLHREVRIEAGATTRVRFDLSPRPTRSPRDYGF